MAAVRTAAGERLDAILADGKWHARQDLVAACAPLVPPGQATRTAARRRSKDRSRVVPAPHRKPDDDRNAIDVGARVVINDLLYNRALERREVAGRVEYRNAVR